MNGGYVDVVVLPLMPEIPSGLAKAVGGSLSEGYATERYLEKMDAARVAISVLVAGKGGRHERRGGPPFEKWEVPVEDVKRVIDRYPARFRGIVGVDPTRTESSLRELEHAVTELKFVGAHLYPHWWGFSPDNEVYFPFYEKCGELDVPIQIQVGSSLVPFLPSIGRPITLESVAIAFPELVIVASHTGWPWVDEMIAVMQSHPNVYLTTSCHYPKTDWQNPVSGLRPLPRWDDALVNFINDGLTIDGSRGEEKVLMGTDFPEWEFSIMLQEAREILRPSAFERVCRDNATRVYRLHQ